MLEILACFLGVKKKMGMASGLSGFIEKKGAMLQQPITGTSREPKKKHKWGGGIALPIFPHHPLQFTWYKTLNT